MKRTMMKTLVLIAMLVITLVISGCGNKTKIDLQECTHVEPYGANGYGKTNDWIDEEMLLALIQIEETDDESLVAALEKLDLLTQIEYELDNTEKLSNGDKITVTVTYPDSLEDALDADITPKNGSSWTVEVSGLGEPEKVDVFENITLEYIVGNTLCAKGQYTYLDYTLSQTQGLSNGDTVTISISAPDGSADLDGYCMENYGWMPISDSCEHNVTGIDEYPLCLEDIPEELFEKLRMVAQMQIEAMGEQMVSNFGDQGYHMNHYALESVYVASPKENVKSSSKNEVYLVFKINATNPDGTRDFYYSAVFPNVTIKESGEYWYNADHVLYPDGEYGSWFYGDNFFCTGTEGEGFIGFEEEADFYDWYLAEWEDTWRIERSSIEE